MGSREVKVRLPKDLLRTVDRSKLLAKTNEFSSTLDVERLAKKMARSKKRPYKRKFLAQWRQRRLQERGEKSKLTGWVKFDRRFFKPVLRRTKYSSMQKPPQSRRLFVEKTLTYSELLRAAMRTLGFRKKTSKYGFALHQPFGKRKAKDASSLLSNGRFVDDRQLKHLSNGFTLHLCPSPVYFARRAMLLLEKDRLQASDVKKILIVLRDSVLTRTFVDLMGVVRIAEFVLDWLPRINRKSIPSHFRSVHLWSLVREERWLELEKLTERQLELLERMVINLDDRSTSRELFDFCIRFTVETLKKCPIYGGAFLNQIDLDFVARFIPRSRRFNFRNVMTMIVAILEGEENVEELAKMRDKLASDVYLDYFHAVTHTQQRNDNHQLAELLLKVQNIRTTVIHEALGYVPSAEELNELKALVQQTFNEDALFVDEASPQLPSGVLGFDMLVDDLKRIGGRRAGALIRNGQLFADQYFAMYCGILDHLLSLMLPQFIRSTAVRLPSSGDAQSAHHEQRWTIARFVENEDTRFSQMAGGQYKTGWGMGEIFGNFPKESRRCDREWTDVYTPLLLTENDAIQQMHRVLCTFFCDLWVLPKISELNDEKRARVVTKIIGQMLEWSLDPMPLQLNKWYDALVKAPEYVRLYRETHNDEEKGRVEVQKKQWMDLMSGKISYKMEDILWDVLIQRNQRGYDFRKFADKRHNSREPRAIVKRHLVLDENETFFILNDEDGDPRDGPKEIHSSRVHKLIEGDEYERKYAEKYCPVPSPSKLSKLWQKLRTIGRKNRASLTALLPASIPPGLIVQTFEEEFDIISVEGEEEKFEEFVEGLKFLKYKQFPPAELEMLVNTEVKIRLAALKYVDVSEEPTDLPADLEPPVWMDVPSTSTFSPHSKNRKPRSSFNF